MSARKFAAVVFAVSIPASALDMTAAHAQSAGKAADKVVPALKELLAPKHGSEICFARIYDDAHMKQHPKQKVRQMSFLMNVKYLKENNLYRYNFTMHVSMKGRSKMLETSGECGWAFAEQPNQRQGPLIRCNVECDGGGVSIEQQRGTDNLLVHLTDTDEHGRPGRPGRIRMAACGEDEEENSVDLVSGADDKTFRLTKAPARMCRSSRAR
jgi:hypothetical protein